MQQGGLFRHGEGLLQIGKPKTLCHLLSLIEPKRNVVSSIGKRFLLGLVRIRP